MIRVTKTSFNSRIFVKVIRQLFIALALFVVVAHGTIPHNDNSSSEVTLSSASLGNDLWAALSAPMRILPESHHPDLCLNVEKIRLDEVQTLVILIGLGLLPFEHVEERPTFNPFLCRVFDDPAFGKWRNRPPPSVA